MRKSIVIAFLLLSFCIDGFAQLTFNRIDSIKVTDQSAPLANAWAGGLNYPMFFEIDLNGDNIVDLVAYENGDAPGHNRIMPFLNGGTAGQVDYHFAPQYISHFPDVTGFMLSYDYNHDGRMDLFSLSAAINSGIMVWRNDYAVGPGLQFTMVKDPILTRYSFSSFNIFANTILVPALADVDNDGDMDILSWPSWPNGMLEYQRNLEVDSGWTSDSLRFKNVTACWGGFALEILNPENKVNSFGISCRMGDHDTSVYIDAATSGNKHSGNALLIFDNNGDGVKDVLIGDVVANNLLLVRNGGTTIKDSMVSQDQFFPSYNTSVDLEFPSPFYFDADNDGAKDLIVTSHIVNDYRGILYYKNIGTTSNPVFALQPKTLLQEDMIEVGTGAVPRLFDYDADGIPDLLIGDESWHDPATGDHRGITLYKNIGTASHPEFQLVTRDYAGLDALNGLIGTFSPTFGDLDGDGDIDMITGYKEGKLLYFENTAGANNPAVFTAPTGSYQGIDVGQYSAPQLYDLNHDGRLDLIIGNSAGIIKYYQDTSITNTPGFKLTKDTLGGILIYRLGGVIAISDSLLHSGNAAPFLYNDAGTDKLVLGTQVGKVYVFDNIMGNISGQYRLADSLVNGEEGQLLNPCIGDINNDGHPDMFIGNYNGGVSFYMNTDTSVPVNSYDSPRSVRSSFTVYPNPASSEIHLSFYHIENAHATFELVNNLGQVVYKDDVTESTVTISMDNFSNGLYLLRFVSDDNRQTQKIIVRKH